MLSWAAALLFGPKADSMRGPEPLSRMTTRLPKLRVDVFDDIGEDDSEAFLDEFEKMSSSTKAKVKIVAGDKRCLVRPASHPTTPPRKSSAEKVLFIEWLTSESLILEAADQFDCGCGLYEEGCYNKLVVALMASKKLARLLKSRRVRFTTPLAKLKPTKLLELSNVCVNVDDSTVYFDFAVHHIKVPPPLLMNECRAGRLGTFWPTWRIFSARARPGTPTSISLVDSPVDSLVDSLVKLLVERPRNNPKL